MLERNEAKMQKTVLKTLTDYFNEGDGKRSLTEWSKEIKVLTPDEKMELAEGVCAITGDSIAIPTTRPMK